MKRIFSILLALLSLAFIFSGCNQHISTLPEQPILQSPAMQSNLPALKEQFDFSTSECDALSKLYIGMKKTEFNSIIKTIDSFPDLTSSNIGDYIEFSRYYLNGHPRMRIEAVCYLPEHPNASGGELLEMSTIGDKLYTDLLENDLLVKSIYIITEEGRRFPLFEASAE